MRYQRHLPHWTPEEVALHVTWRLANSLPAPDPEYFIRDDYTLRPPIGPKWLSDSRIARLVVDAMHYGAEQRHLYQLFAYVVMPNHVHVLIETNVPLREIMRWLKGRTARVANRILGRTNQPFWAEESYDHIIRSAKEFRDTLSYIEANPVRAGLVQFAEQWRWSSANLDRPQKAMACPTEGDDGR